MNMESERPLTQVEVLLEKIYRVDARKGRLALTEIKSIFSGNHDWSVTESDKYNSVIDEIFNNLNQMYTDAKTDDQKKALYDEAKGYISQLPEIDEVREKIREIINNDKFENN